jgi:hypothetical protein
MLPPNLAERCAALRLDAKRHKAALAHHRRQLRAVMQELAEIEARCARLGLTVELIARITPPSR